MSTIMVVDDEKDVRYVVRQVLERNGYTVIETSNGKECLEKMKEKRPDLVLLDIMMPGLDGWGVLGEMQRDSSLKSIPVTMFTVKPLTTETLRKKEIEGLVNYIVKPFSKEGLVKSISQTLDSLSKAGITKKKLEDVSDEIAEEYDKLSRRTVLHKNFLSFFESILKQRKEDGSLDDIQSFEDVIKSESMLIDSYTKRKKEIEDLIRTKAQKTKSGA
ncbi:MAG: response regulator [Candidatus Hydrothermarchaeales archaeon]